MNTLITNNKVDNFYNHLTSLLNSCKAFYFNVAFINFSGIQLLLDTLKNCEKKGTKGKILTSTYLNFTEVKALEKLKEFSNLEIKIFDTSVHNIGFHSKAYIFEFEDEYKILLGSSNITASAFKSNIEWNIKSISKKDDIFLKDIKDEFYKLWDKSFFINDDFLAKYENFRQCIKQNNFVYKQDLKANFMQEQALRNLENLRKEKEDKALAIASTGSGKTILAAFDVRNFTAKRLLFIVHRENILLRAKESFENIIPNKTMFREEFIIFGCRRSIQLHKVLIIITKNRIIFGCCYRSMV